jgi:hypothetical protein
MPNDEYRELIEFLGRKFDEVDARFGQVDARFGQVDARLAEMATKDEVRAQQAETRRHFDVMVESLLDQVGTVAEGVVNLDEKLERFRESVASEFSETQSMIRLS